MERDFVKIPPHIDLKPTADIVPVSVFLNPTFNKTCDLSPVVGLCLHFANICIDKFTVQTYNQDTKNMEVFTWEKILMKT